MPASNLLLVESDATSRDVISNVLTSVGYTVTVVSDATEAFRRAGEHQLVLLDVVTGDRSAADVCREIRSTPSMAAIPVLCISQSDDVDDRIRFLEAGADDVMAKPFDARELEARVEALLLRFQRSRDLTPTVALDGATAASRRVVSVFSPKGGVGTTTIAVNIAVATAMRRPERTLLIDLDRQFGQVATHLNLTARATLADVVRDESARREPEFLRSFAAHHESGLHVLPAPGSPELGETVGNEQVERLLANAADAYDAVIVDVGSHLDEQALTALEGADGVVFPFYPEIAALKALHSLIDVLGEIGSVVAKSTFVLNNMFAKEILKMRDIEGALGTKVAVDLPYDPFIYLKAVNEGIPVVRGAPRSLAAERLTQLAWTAFGEDVAATVPVEEEEHKSGFGLFGGRRRRA
ncbi:MAG: CpaE family protein [Candidatus Limnocylindrales bacterium]